MRCNCRCNTELDPFARQLAAAALCAALAPTEYLVFTKTEWVEDCGFIVSEELVAIPRGFDGKKAKNYCFSKCLDLLTRGWQNSIAEKNEDMMIGWLLAQTD
jgi:hypothetical protein